VEVLHPPENELSVPLYEVAVTNLVDVAYANIKQFENGQVIAQFNRISDVLIQESVKQLTTSLNSEGIVKATDTTFSRIRKIGKFNASGSSEEYLNEVCQRSPFNAIVAIEGFNADIDNDSQVNYSTPVDRNYGTVQIPYFSGNQSVFMEMLFRVYTCRAGVSKLENSSRMSTQVSITSNASSPYELDSRMATADNILIQAAQKLGRNYSTFLIPHWKTETRVIFPSGNDQFRESFTMATVGKWKDAADIWYLLATSNNTKVASRATFNLILANEMLGKLSEAEELLRLCIEKYDLREAKKYAPIIEERIRNTRKINEKFPNMDFR
jgi:hypothetical protein